MASNDEESRVSLKLLVDDKNKRVIAAEANRDFVDILFSFLTFPVGTIIRLSNSQPMSMPKISTCMNNLYKSVENLSIEHLYTEYCKSVLLNPRNPCNEDCFNLKVKIDDSVSNKYFKCSNGRCFNKSWLDNVKCRCGWRTTKEIYPDVIPTVNYSGVFLCGGIEFIISDDLRVLPGSPSSLVQLFSDLGYSHMNEIREMFVEVGKEEILRLLICSLISKSPLTEVFMNKQAIVDNNIMPEPRISQVFPDLYTENSSTINLKLILSKSRNKILYAEANDSFADFLFSFLTFPIGSVIYTLNGISGLGCIDNLYKSVKDLELKWFSHSQNKLLNPGVAPRHVCPNQLLPIYAKGDCSLIDPRDISGGTSEFGRLTKSPSLFVVSDDLEVKPMCSTSSFALLRELNVPFYDIEEQVISIDKEKARCLLQAALNGSSSALTLALSSFLKEEKD